MGPVARTLCGIPEDQWIPERDVGECHLACHRVLGVSEALLWALWQEGYRGRHDTAWLRKESQESIWFTFGGALII